MTELICLRSSYVFRSFFQNSFDLSAAPDEATRFTRWTAHGTQSEKFKNDIYIYIYRERDVEREGERESVCVWEREREREREEWSLENWWKVAETKLHLRMKS